MFLGYGYGDPANMAKNMVQSVPPFWDPVISNEQVATGLLSGKLTWHYIAMDKHHFWWVSQQKSGTSGGFSIAMGVPPNEGFLLGKSP